VTLLPGTQQSWINDINDNGVVMGQAYSAGYQHAFAWTATTGIVPLALGGTYSYANGLSDDDVVAGSAYLPTGESHAFVWTPTLGVQDLGTLGGTHSYAWIVRNLVVGNSSLTGDSGSSAFVWTPTAGSVGLSLGGTYSQINEVNGNREVVGYAHLPGNSTYHAFFWSETAGFTDLGTLGGPWSQGYGLNDDGTVIGQSATTAGESRPFVWRAGEGMTNLGTLGGSWGYAYDINNRGQIVGQTSTTDGESHATLWDGSDETAPSAAPTQAPAVNGAGWNRDNVVVTWNWTDNAGGSGIDAANCTTSSVSSGEGTSIALNATCADSVGNVGTASYTVKVDQTPPTINAAATSSPNAAGWYKTDVVVAFGCADGLSGISTCPPNQTLTAEGTAVPSSAETALDTAGNTSAPSNVVTVKIDKTLPVVSLTGGPANGSSHYFGAVPSAPTCTASDALSGLDTCVISGFSTAVGAHTVTATAKDKAGNQKTASATYTVQPWTLAGFYQPVDMGGVLNTVKNGSTVPIKFKVFAGTTELVDPAVVIQPLKATENACESASTDEIELTVSGATSLRYDVTSGQFIYNWQTPKKPNFCYTVTVTLSDGTAVNAKFKLR
jgi:probable HAF family extracellular repeat protein